jgi:hypothetical protein
MYRLARGVVDRLANDQRDGHPWADRERLDADEAAVYPSLKARARTRGSNGVDDQFTSAAIGDRDLALSDLALLAFRADDHVRAFEDRTFDYRVGAVVAVRCVTTGVYRQDGCRDT